MSQNWKARTRPARLERRVEFSDFEETRNFLDRAAELAESHGNYPDMSFGRTYVSITLYPGSETEEVGDELQRYASMIDALLPSAQPAH